MEELQNRVLLVTVHRMLYPISAEVLHQVFSPYGFVENIVGCESYYGFQALIQYQFRHSAILAWNSLQGRNIYDGCCLLDIQFPTIDRLRLYYHEELSLQPESGDTRSILDRMEKTREEIKTELMRLSENSSSSTVTVPPPETRPEVEPAYVDGFLDSEFSKFSSVSPSFFTSPNIPDEDVAQSVSRVSKIDGMAYDEASGSACEITLGVELESIIDVDGKGLEVIDRKGEYSVDLDILDVCLSTEELDVTNYDDGDALVDEDVLGESFLDFRDLHQSYSVMIDQEPNSMVSEMELDSGIESDGLKLKNVGHLSNVETAFKLEVKRQEKMDVFTADLQVFEVAVIEVDDICNLVNLVENDQLEGQALEPVFQVGGQVSGMRNCFDMPMEFQSKVSEIDFLGVEGRIEMLQLEVGKKCQMDYVKLVVRSSDRMNTVRRKCEDADFGACAVIFVLFIDKKPVMEYGQIVEDDIELDFKRYKKKFAVKE